MHNNYYFLRKLSHQLKDELIGFTIEEVFSQSKNELILSLYKDKKERHIKAHLSPQFCCLSFPETFTRARRNSVDLFRDIIGFEIIDVCQIKNDRSFYFILNNGWLLLFKMHGNRSNIILIQDKRVLEVFKSSLVQDTNIKIDELAKHLVIDKKQLEIQEGNYNKLIPTLGKSFKIYFDRLNYDQSNSDHKIQCLMDLLNYLENPDFYIHLNPNGIPQLSLIKIDEKRDLNYETPIDALNAFFAIFISSFELEKEKAKLRNSISGQIKKADSYINTSSEKLSKLDSISNYKHLGDLIMANLHQIKPYSAEVMLIDFYSEKTVKIPLKVNLTPQLNAEKYYRKAKKQKIEIDALSANIEKKRRIRDNLARELLELDQIATLKQVQRQSSKNSKIDDSQFHKIDFMDYEILIGKNASKNEFLTFKVAKKDDLFLHAKDSPGSHVIIKKKSKQNFPQDVIEKAASFAAYYSKNKTESFCRVLYTPKKYVRKAKGMPAGTVIIEKEKVVLAKPEKI